MTPTEELLRAATRQAAAEITPDSIQPLDPATLTGPRRRHGAGRAGPRRAAERPGGWHRLGVPLAAAAAVILVAGLSVGLPRVLGGGSAAAPGGKPTGTSAATGQPTAAGGTSAAPTRSPGAPVPPYYVALVGTGSPPYYLHPFNLAVRNTLTGKTLAAITPAHAPAPGRRFGSFSTVWATASHTTFLVGAQPWAPVTNSRYAGDNTNAPVTLLLLHFHPATGKVTFTPLPVPPVPGFNLWSASLSPDGSRLAVGTMNGSGTASALTVYPLRGGPARTWTLAFPVTRESTVSASTWLSDRTLAFNLDGDPTVPDRGYANTTIRTIDVTGPGGSLLADSRKIFTQSARDFLCASDLMLSRDLSTVTCAGSLPAGDTGNGIAQRVAKLAEEGKLSQLGTGSPNGGSGPPVTFGFAQFSVATGTMTALLDRTVDPDTGHGLWNADLLWTDGSGGPGETLIGILSGPVFILRGGAERDIPWNSQLSGPGGVIKAAW